MSNEKNLTAVIKLLRKMAAAGTMDLGKKKDVEKGIRILRRAYRSADPAKLRKAIDAVSRMFLRHLDS